MRVDDLRLKERVTIHVETLALLFSSVKVKRQPVTISDEAKQRLKLGVEHGKQKPIWSEICKREPIDFFNFPRMLRSQWSIACTGSSIFRRGRQHSQNEPRRYSVLSFRLEDIQHNTAKQMDHNERQAVRRSTQTVHILRSLRQR
jgi:hypothetical protein